MKEHFVTYEIALKLKEIGFSGKCFSKYTKVVEDGISQLSISEYAFDYITNKPIYGSCINYNTEFHGSEGTISAPLWQQAIDWLGDKHGILFEIRHIPRNGGLYKVLILEDDFNKWDAKAYVLSYYPVLFKYSSNDIQPTLIEFKEYSNKDKAREIAILEAIKIITK